MSFSNHFKTEAGPVSEALCFLVFRIPEEVQKPSNSECSFSLYLIDCQMETIMCGLIEAPFQHIPRRTKENLESPVRIGYVSGEIRTQYKFRSDAARPAVAYVSDCFT
jgi:hypothetical protein